VSVLHDGVATRRFAPSGWHAEGKGPRSIAGRVIPESTRVVSFVARSLDRLRGLDRFLEVADAVLRARPDALIVVVGDPIVRRGLDVAFHNKDYRAHLLTQRESSDRQRLWFLAGVKNVAIPQEFLPQLRADARISANIDHAAGFTLIPTANPDLPSHALVGMRDYLNKATLVPKAEILSPEDTLKRIADRNWDPRDTVLIAAPGRQLTIAKNLKPSTRDSAEVLTYTPTQIVIRVESIKGGYLLVNDQYDPDWQVDINGAPAMLFRADYLLRAVEIDLGESLVTMRYVAHYHIAGFDLSVRRTFLFCDAMMLAAWITAFLALRRRKLDQPPMPNPV